MSEHTLRVSSLYKNFGKKKVVQGIDFEMNTGEVLGLLGPNGAGKTTTFYMIVGFHKPSAGDIFLDDLYRCSSAPVLAFRTFLRSLLFSKNLQ